MLILSRASVAVASFRFRTQAADLLFIKVDLASLKFLRSLIIKASALSALEFQNDYILLIDGDRASSSTILCSGDLVSMPPKERQLLDLNTLDADQLNSIRDQLEEDIQSFARSVVALQKAAGEFGNSGRAIETLAEQTEGNPEFRKNF